MKMSNMTSESEDRMQSTDCINSPSDEASTERNMMGNGTLKKGPWTSAEDAILMEYVSKNGQGNWNAVQKDSGLSRCGKSCRLRWANHLRPDLKKGAFTPEEERRIIELHAKMGNKWARMAIELPGRTDNEIKNFWNTRTKRRQRAGLPIYPPDICLQTLSDNNTQPHPYPNRDTEIIPNNNFQIPGVEFKNFALNQDLLFSQSLLHLPGPTFLDIPTNTLLPQTLGPTSHTNNNFFFPVSQSHPPKRIRRYPIYDGGGGGGGGGLDDIFPASLYDDHVRSGSHAYLNGNKTSSSDPISWAMKMELPSLQYISTTQLGSGSCGPPSSPLPSLESVDTLVQSSTLIGQEKSTDRNSGLLEAVLYESQTLKKSKRDNTSSDDWEEAYVDAMSPLGHSSASVFSEYTPHVSDEHHSLEAISVKQESDEKSKSNHMKYCRPDLLLENSWFGSMSGSDHCGLIDPIGDDFCNGLSHLVGPGAIDGSPFDDESAKWDEIS
ncbi:hypothetical protein LXL04_014682 [Taraxacum kok-saghyz]